MQPISNYSPKWGWIGVDIISIIYIDTQVNEYFGSSQTEANKCIYRGQ